MRTLKKVKIIGDGESVLEFEVVMELEFLDLFILDSLSLLLHPYGL